MLHGGSTFSDARDRIAEGNQRIEAGQGRVDAKTILLEEGRQRRQKGKQPLQWAKSVRIACGAGAIDLFAAAIVLAFVWRRSLIRTVTRADR